MNISKELLSEVLGKRVHSTQTSKDNYTIDKNAIRVHFVDSMYFYDINIHELAHKCKDWLWNKNIDFTVLFSRCHSPCRRVVEVHLDKDIYSVGKSLHEGVFRGSDETELTAIFKACQFILDNKDK